EGIDWSKVVLKDILDPIKADISMANGSNAWAVSKEKSATGNAMLAGDPHLPVPIPNLVYDVHLECPTWKASGASIPSTFGILIGRTDNIAWSITLGYAQLMDLYVEKCLIKGDEAFYELNG